VTQTPTLVAHSSDVRNAILRSNERCRCTRLSNYHGTLPAHPWLVCPQNETITRNIVDEYIERVTRDCRQAAVTGVCGGDERSGCDGCLRLLQKSAAVTGVDDGGVIVIIPLYSV